MRNMINITMTKCYFLYNFLIRSFDAFEQSSPPFIVLFYLFIEIRMLTNESYISQPLREAQKNNFRLQHLTL